MAADFADNGALLPAVQTGRVFDGSLFAVGGLCGIFEFRGISFELGLFFRPSGWNGGPAAIGSPNFCQVF